MYWDTNLDFNCHNMILYGCGGLARLNGLSHFWDRKNVYIQKALVFHFTCRPVLIKHTIS